MIWGWESCILQASGNQTRPGKIPGLGWFYHPNLHDSRGGSTNGIQNGWFRKWKIPSRNGWWLGVPLFQETTISCWWSHLVSQWYPNVPGNHRYYPCTYPSLIPTMFHIRLNDPRNPLQEIPIISHPPHILKRRIRLAEQGFSHISRHKGGSLANVRGFLGKWSTSMVGKHHIYARISTENSHSYEKPTMKVDRFRTWNFPQDLTDLTHWKWGFDEHKWKLTLWSSRNLLQKGIFW